MVRKKTSIYIDEKLWEKFKRYAVIRGKDISSLLEEIIRDEVMDYLDEALYQLSGSNDYKFDFEPVESKEPVSKLVRKMRDERGRNIFR